MTGNKTVINGEMLQRTNDVPIFDARGEKVIVDADLAYIYGVTPKELNQAVKRNVKRFPSDFCFQCTADEWKNIQILRSQSVILRSQNAILRSTRGKHRKYRPYVFTEHGALMAANILRSPRATEMSVFVIRAFIRMRGVVSANKELAAKIKELERRTSKHDKQLRVIFEAIHLLMEPPSPPKQPIGFQLDETTKLKNAKRK